MSDPLPPPPETPAANTRSRTLRFSIAASPTRPVPSVPQRPQRAKPSKSKQTTKSKRAKKPAGPILIPAYVESASSEEEGSDDEPSSSEFTFGGRVFRKATDFVIQGKRQKSSHIWDKDKGFKIIDVKARTSHYYCIQCCDKEKDEDLLAGKPLYFFGTCRYTTCIDNLHFTNLVIMIRKQRRLERMYLISVFYIFHRNASIKLVI